MDASEILVIVKELFDETEPTELSTILLKRLSSFTVVQIDDFDYDCVIELAYRRT